MHKEMVNFGRKIRRIRRENGYVINENTVKEIKNGFEMVPKLT